MKVSIQDGSWNIRAGIFSLIAGFYAVTPMSQALAETSTIQPKIYLSTSTVKLSPGHADKLTVTCKSPVSVSLKLSGSIVGSQQTQVAGSFNSPAIQCTNSSTLTLTVGSGVALGNYTLTVSGTSAGRTGSADLSLQVVEGQWQQLGGALDNNVNDYIDQGSTAVDAFGNPIVAFSEFSGSGADILLVKRWNGSAWELLGGSSGLNVKGSVQHAISLVIDHNANPVVAWAEWSSSANYVYIKRWDGVTWNLLGGGTVGQTGSSYAVSMGIDANNNPMVAFPNFNQNIVVMRLNGSSWTQIGQPLSLLPSYDLSLAVNTAGNPVVAWEQNNASAREIRVGRWNGTSWEPMGSAALNAGYSSLVDCPSLAIDKNNRTVVAWNEGNSIYAKRWSGSAWNSIGDAVTTESINGYTGSDYVELDSAGNPVVVFITEDPGLSVYAKRWNGTAWVDMGDMLDIQAPGITYHPSLAVDTLGNMTVAWTEEYNSPEDYGNLYVKRYTQE